ncbi:MAG: SpoIIE family protein phosphatase [Bacteroidia bacterium]|nr:SpoIIE family protein phosphatase [Bacteroidia bacterium]
MDWSLGFFLAAFSVTLWSCEEKAVPPLSNPLRSAGETLAVQPPETIPLPDTILSALRQTPTVKGEASMRWMALRAETLSCDLSQIFNAFELLRVGPSGRRAYKFSDLRPHISFLGHLRRSSFPLTLQKVSGEFQSIVLGKSILPETPFFPTVMYDQESGMPLTSPVEGVEEDAHGRVWVFTQNALLCWAGQRVDVFNGESGLPTQSVLQGTWTPSNRLWVCGAQGLACWDGYRFYKMPLGDSIQRVVGVVYSGEQILYLRVRGRSLRDSPLVGWRNDTLYKWSCDKAVGIFPIYSDSVGLWCSVYEDGAFSLGVVREDTLWRVEGWSDKTSAQRLLWDSRGRLWIANRRGLWRWEGGHAVQIARGAITALNEASGGRLVCLNEGNLCYTAGDSLKELDVGLPRTAYDYIYRRPNNEWLLFSREGWVAVLQNSGVFSIPTARLLGEKDWIFAVYPTSHGGLWVGTEQSGLLYISPKAQAYRYSLPGGSDYLDIEEVASIRAQDTLAWLSWYSQGRRQATYLRPLSAQIAYPSPSEEHWIDVCRSPQGWVWQSHPEIVGVSISGARAIRHRISLRPTSPFFRDSKGWIWFGAQEGLHVWTGAVLLRYPLPRSSSFVLSLAEDHRGRLLVGTLNSGLYCLEGAHWRRWTRQHGLPEDLVAQIVPVRSRVWIGSGSGIACLDMEDGRLFTWRGGTGIIGTTGVNGGLLRSAQASVDSVCVMGRLCPGSWLTGAGGSILCFTPEIDSFSAPPRPYIASVEIKGLSLSELDSLGWIDSVSRGLYALPIGLRLPYEKNSLAFSFSCGGPFLKQRGVEYRVFLEGFDETWTPPSSPSRMEYRRLPPGRYKLYVCARYPDSEWSSPAVFSFTIDRPWWLSPWAFLIYIGLFASGIWGIVRWRTAVLRARAHELSQKVEEATATIREQNALLQQQNIQLAEQNKLISEQKEEIEAKNRSLLDSITYARRIQTAIVPPESAIMRYFPDSFIFWRPRDIVSGDVYGLYPDLLDSQDLYLLVADCTGHGVPGAFMSLLSLALLNRTITEYRLMDPAEILSIVSQQLVTLLQPDSPGHVRDGFEGVLAKFIWREGRFTEIAYASARSPFWLVRQGEIYEQPYDPIPVGPPEISRKAQSAFTSRRLSLEPGDWVYFASDGFIDQMGGPKGRKYGYKAFRQLLLQLSSLSTAEQKARLQQEIDTWRGAYPQVDDILILGIYVRGREEVASGS